MSTPSKRALTSASAQVAKAYWPIYVSPFKARVFKFLFREEFSKLRLDYEMISLKYNQSERKVGDLRREYSILEKQSDQIKANLSNCNQKRNNYFDSLVIAGEELENRSKQIEKLECENESQSEMVELLQRQMREMESELDKRERVILDLQGSNSVDQRSVGNL